MSKFFQKLGVLLKDKSVRGKILFTISALVIFRLLAAVPVPGINTSLLESFLDQNQYLGFLNIISGGGLSNLSIMMLGIGPYITASIIMQLMTLVFPQVKSWMQEEGEAGRMKFSQITRYLTVPLAIIQGYALLTLLSNQGIISSFTTSEMVINIGIVTAGAVLLMWIGELITEFGIGNGASMIVFGSIVAGAPSSLAQLYQTFDPSLAMLYIGLGVASLIALYAVVYVTEAERPVPITQARSAFGAGRQTPGGEVQSYIPIRVVTAGVIPIIFAISLLVFPQLLASVFSIIGNETLQNISTQVNLFLENTWVYALLYAALVFFFTYFYTPIVTDPHQITEEQLNRIQSSHDSQLESVNKIYQDEKARPVP